MKTLKTIFNVLLLAACIQALPSGAVPATGDQSDLWWNPSESGWGLQMVDRADTIFATMYVYGPDGSPIWYTALMSYQGNLTWTGDLYQSSGSWFGSVPYNTGAFQPHKVGTMKWTAAGSDSASGTLTYSVNGVAVVKNIVRTYIATDDFSGVYLGGLHIVNAGCTDPTKNGTAEGFTNIDIVQTGSSVQLTLTPQGGHVCTFTGTLSQAGRFGSVTGAYNCDNGTNGTFVTDGTVVGINTFSAHFTAVDAVTGCNAAGYLAGIRHR